MKKFDIIIIGGGPAGLSALYFLSLSGYDVCLIERGKSYGERIVEKTPYNIANGIGGAGLFSDGKYSFPPSASFLWTETNPDQLKKAYESIRALVKSIGMEFPKWSSSWVEVKNRAYEKKDYNSIYFPDEKQYQLTELLLGNMTLTHHSVEAVSISKRGESYIIEDSLNLRYAADYVIVATGKHGANLLLKSSLQTQPAFKEEVGVRIECDSEVFLPFADKTIDYKLIKAIDCNTEARTFCCCKEGRILESCTKHYHSFNGTKWENSCRSNIGILIRTESPNSVYHKEIFDILSAPKYVTSSLLDFINGEFTAIGPNCDKAIKSMISYIIDTSQLSKLRSALMVSPEIEYIGNYPVFNSATLSLPGERVWVVGDVSGKYRGLLPALISGAYAAFAIQGDEK